MAAKPGRHWGSEARVKAELVGVKASPGAKLSVVALLMFRNATTNQCNPSEQRLAELLGTSDRNIRRYIVDAETAGLKPCDVPSAGVLDNRRDTSRSFVSLSPAALDGLSSD
jgi:hypothetical protein